MYKSFFQLSTSHGTNVAKKSDSDVLNDSLSFVSEAFGSFFLVFASGVREERESVSIAGTEMRLGVVLRVRNSGFSS